MNFSTPKPFRCVWCQTTVHDDCMDNLANNQCNLGEFHHLIIPPHYLYHVNKLRRRHLEEYAKVPADLLIALVLAELLKAALMCLCRWRRPAGAAGLQFWSWPTLVVATTWGRCFWENFAHS